MGVDFMSKVRDRVRKSWRASYAERVNCLPFLDRPTDRTTLRARLGAGSELADGDRVILRLAAPATVQIIDGLRVVAECDAAPLDLVGHLQADDGIASGIVVGMGQLLPTVDIEVEPGLPGGPPL